MEAVVERLIGDNEEERFLIGNTGDISVLLSPHHVITMRVSA